MNTDFVKLFACSDVYQLLSMFLRLPTKELVEGLRDGSLADDVENIFHEIEIDDTETALFMESLRESSLSDTPEETLSGLRREYTRMFSNPKKPEIDIYEALFLWDKDSGEPKPSLFISPAALDAERCYKKAGLARSKEINESADHFATQMEFMMFLYADLATSLQEDEGEKYENTKEILQEFEQLHLKRWAQPFFKRCCDICNHPIMTGFWSIGDVFLRNYAPGSFD